MLTVYTPWTQHLGVYSMRQAEQSRIMALNHSYNAMVVMYIYMFHGIQSNVE